MATKYKTTAKGRIAPNGYRLCDPLQVGEQLPAIDKTRWIVGKPIGCGGFGEIYTCHEASSTQKNQHVMKVDNLNGPLFVEVHFMLRVCKPNIIDEYVRKRECQFLGIPRYITSGTDSTRKCAYRFLVMERLGEELQTVLDRSRISIPLACRITCRIIDALEYIHEHGYIHSDIKAANILKLPQLAGKSQKGPKRGAKRGSTTLDEDNEDRYYLIDFGLAEKYIFENTHKPYEEDKRRANNGTCEFRSRDAHIGVISRKSDMESLGYNMILWLYGRHPWENLLKNNDNVYDKKCWAMENIPEFLDEAFSDTPLPESKPEPAKSSLKGGGKKAAADKVDFERPKRTYAVNPVVPKGLDAFFAAVNQMSHEERPPYVLLKRLVMQIAKNSDQPDASPKKRPSISTRNAHSIAKKELDMKLEKEKRDSESELESLPAKTTATNGTINNSSKHQTSSARNAQASKARPRRNVRLAKAEPTISKSEEPQKGKKSTKNSSKAVVYEFTTENDSTQDSTSPEIETKSSKQDVVITNGRSKRTLNSDKFKNVVPSEDAVAAAENSDDAEDECDDEVDSPKKKRRASSFFHSVSLSPPEMKKSSGGFSGRITRTRSSEQQEHDVQERIQNKRLQSKPASTSCQPLPQKATFHDSDLNSDSTDDEHGYKSPRVFVRKSLVKSSENDRKLISSRRQDNEKEQKTTTTTRKKKVQLKTETKRANQLKGFNQNFDGSSSDKNDDDSSALTLQSEAESEDLVPLTTRRTRRMKKRGEDDENDNGVSFDYLKDDRSNLKSGDKSNGFGGKNLHDNKENGVSSKNLIKSPPKNENALMRKIRLMIEAKRRANNGG